ncbi:MAG: TlpA family protein disulfide reductase [Armatimonadetes bacterium]|nr:TlpA family protein disulfide reductase [Armatimonadota bacterium]
MKNALILTIGLGLAVMVHGLIRPHHEEGAASSAAAPEYPSVPIDSLAPEFKVEDLTGRPTTLTSLRGKVVVLNFWATYCGFCMMELPVLQKVADAQDKSKVVFLTINTDVPDGAELRRFVRDKKIKLPVYLDPENKVSNDYLVDILPTLYIIDPKGKVHKVYHGFVPRIFKEDLTAALSHLTTEHRAT